MKISNINTVEEFIELDYEPEQQGHVHAELMAQYAEDARNHKEPWKLWELRVKGGDWYDCSLHPYWLETQEFRRKPKTHIG